MPRLEYRNTNLSSQQSDLPTIAQHLFSLMLRNVSSKGFVFVDPLVPGRFSAPGCIIASPSYPADLTTVNQDYVFNWTRDAAITAMELAAANPPFQPGEGSQPLLDYVTFAKTCQDGSMPTIGHACFTIEGQPRPWTEQSDGPALQTLAIVQAFPQLDTQTQGVARTLIRKNLDYLLAAYKNPTRNLWEEKDGLSFFARAVQLRCFKEITTNAYGIAVPAATTDAVAWLDNALNDHWNGSYYVSLLDPTPEAYDPNIDIVMASVYGAVPCTDTRLLATAAQLRCQWADTSSSSFYPINGPDDGAGIGPMLGRYPGDTYDGDTQDPTLGGHPWALCTCNFAELYYKLANVVTQKRAVPFDSLSAAFFNQLGIDAGTSWNDTVASLNTAGDKMLQAIIVHSDHLELSEQFDGTTGYEKSVRNLTWSYAAFLSAVRTRAGHGVLG